jgi:hypothetical protein
MDELGTNGGRPKAILPRGTLQGPAEKGPKTRIHGTMECATDDGDTYTVVATGTFTMTR